MTRVTKIFEDGALMSLKKAAKSPPIKHGKVLKSLAVARAKQKDSLWAFENFEKELSELRKALIVAERLAKVRTKERNAVSEAHKKRLAQIKELKYQMDDLKFQVEALEEERDEIASIALTPNKNLSRSAAARPIKQR